MLNYIRLVGLSLLLSMSVGSVSKAEELGQGYEEVWYGYQRLLSQKTTTPNTLFISCGALADADSKKTFVRVWHDFKIYKTSGNNLLLFKIKDNKWKPIISDFGHKYVDFNSRTQPLNILEIMFQHDLLESFRAYVPEWESNNVWREPLLSDKYARAEEWNKYFTIMNQVDTTERLDLSSGVYFFNKVSSKTRLQIKALAKPTTISSARQKNYVTNEEFSLSNAEFISCLSLKDF